MKTATVKRLWKYVSKHKKLMIFSIMLVLVSTSCGLGLPWVLGKVVDKILLTKNSNLLIWASILYFSIDITRALSFYLQNFFFSILGQKVLQDLRHDLLTRYQFYPMKEFIVTPTGKLVTRLINDTSSLQDIFTGGLAIAFGEVILVCATVIWLVILNLKLGLCCVCVFPIMVYAAKKFGHHIRIAFRRSRMALSKLNAFLAENIYGISCIQAFNQQAHFKSAFRKKSGFYTEMQLSAVKNYAYFHPCITTLSGISMAALIWYGGFLSLNSAISMGLLVSFMSYLQSLYTPIRDIIEKYNLYISAITATERVFDFLDRPCENQIQATAPIRNELASQTGTSIEFNEVYFRYNPNTAWTLSGITFKAEAGEKIGVVGHTGAGKSTLVSLLMRFYDLNSGSILIENKNILNLSKQELRSQIGYIQQEPFLFSESILDNILLWNAENRKNVEEALTFFPELKLDKQVFEKGANLSTGEKQVISFLRAVACNPRIFILDEATSHIDSITEERIGHASELFFKNKTVITVAHRLSTLKKVSRILVFDKGQIIEQGSHESLLLANGKYAQLHQRHFEKELVEACNSPLLSSLVS